MAKIFRLGFTFDKKHAIMTKFRAGMAELADAHDSGSCVLKDMQVQVLFPAPKSGRKFVRIFLLFVRYAERLSTLLCKFVRIYSLKRTFFRPKKPTHDTTHDTENGKSSSKTMSQRFNISVFAAEIRCCVFFSVRLSASKDCPIMLMRNVSTPFSIMMQEEGKSA